MTLDTRALRLLVLAAWCPFLFWLWTSGELTRYLGPRTAWVVPAGAVVLALVTAGYGWATRGGGDGLRPTRGEVLGCAGLLAPIVLCAVFANASLGSLAASKKLTARGVDVDALARLGGDRGGPVDFLDIRAGAKDPALADERGIKSGRRVALTGFVSQRSRGRFELSRFYITCCVADAVPVGVPVQLSRRQDDRGVVKDRWLAVHGALTSSHGRFVVRADSIRRIGRPRDAYLAFTGS